MSIRHFIDLDDFSSEQVSQLLERAQTYASQADNSSLLQNKHIANLFFENSTRTRTSFELAAKKLGAQVINFDVDRSSLKKGETVYDTMRTLESLGVDTAIIRHSDDYFFETIKETINIPFINAGTGKSAHPTQALLDALTIKQHFGKLDKLKVAICGDIKFSRVAASNYKLLNKFNTELFICAPPGLMPSEEHYPDAKRASIDEVINKVDVVMMLRIQLERHQDLELDSESFLKSFGLTQERAKKMKKEAIIMHPGPFNRDVEIDSSLVESKNSRIFQQVSNGVLARMAVLDYVFNEQTL